MKEPGRGGRALGSLSITGDLVYVLRSRSATSSALRSARSCARPSSSFFSPLRSSRVTLAPCLRVAGEVAHDLLGLAGDLVGDAHLSIPPNGLSHIRLPEPRLRKQASASLVSMVTIRVRSAGRPGHLAATCVLRGRGRRVAGATLGGRGERSSAGRAPGCGPGGRGFESRRSPLTKAPLRRGFRISRLTVAGPSGHQAGTNPAAGRVQGLWAGHCSG